MSQELQHTMVVMIMSAMKTMMMITEHWTTTVCSVVSQYCSLAVSQSLNGNLLLITVNGITMVVVSYSSSDEL